jgi:hypothetical protein
LAVLPLLSGKLVKGGSARLCRKVEKILLPIWGTLGAFRFFWQDLKEFGRKGTAGCACAKKDYWD